MVRVPTHRPPTHPGEMLREEFLEPLGMTQSELSQRLGVPFQRVNSLVNGRRSLTPDTALRLSKLFGMTATLLRFFPEPMSWRRLLTCDRVITASPLPRPVPPMNE